MVVLLPLTPETRHIVDAGFLARMKRGALLVNAGRLDCPYCCGTSPGTWQIGCTCCRGTWPGTSHQMVTHGSGEPARRGPQVDTAALADALHSGHVRAALDVTDPEPLPPGHPLWKVPHVTGCCRRRVECGV